MEGRLEVFLVHDFRVFKKILKNKNKEDAVWVSYWKSEDGEVLQPSTAPAPTPAARGPDSAPPAEEGGEAGASCSSPSVRASLIGVPSTHSTTSPSCCLLLSLGKSNWRARVSPSAAAASRAQPARTAPRNGAETPRAPGRTEALPSAPSAAGGREEVEGGGERERRPSPPPYFPATRSSPPQPL